MKNNAFFGKTDPEFVAINILRDLEIDISKPIDLYFIADKLNIIVKKQKIKRGILGACKAVGLKRLVVLDPDICNEGRERFTLAHEIGHIMLRHGIHCCRTEDFYWNSRRPSIEQDANLFAAELLMPTFSLAEIARKKDTTIELVEKLATERNVSVTAMAIKLVKLSPDPTVLIYFEDGRVKWASYSKDNNFVELTSGITSDMLDGMKISKQYDASTFFDGMSDEATCWAEAKYFSTYNFYLCVVRLDDRYDDAEYD
jgi:Zn-dependent peptidase ImmA (M78 family)